MAKCGGIAAVTASKNEHGTVSETNEPGSIAPDPDINFREETSEELLKANEPTHSASWLVSLIFWLSLLTAASMYAAVALSPKLAEWIAARERYATNAHRLAHLEDEVEYLERVSAALKDDPEFARRLAQASLPANSGEDQHIVPVTEELLFGGRDDADGSQPAISKPAWHNIVRILASNQRYRNCLLITAVLLTILGFTFLNDSESGYLRAALSSLYWLAAIPIRRYRKTDSGTADSIDIDRGTSDEVSTNTSLESPEEKASPSHWKINAPNS